MGRSGRWTPGPTTVASIQIFSRSRSGNSRVEAAPSRTSEKRPLRAGVFVGMRVALGDARVFPRDAADLRPGNADIGEFAVIEAREFAHALIIAPPRPHQ